MSFSTRLRLAVGALSICALTAHAHAPVSTTMASPVAATATLADAPLMMPVQVQGKYKDYLNKRYAADKEARAAVHMFGRKQTGGAVWLIGGGAMLGFLTSQTGTTSDASGTRTFTITPLGYIVLAGLPAAMAISKFARFNNDELYKMLAEYDKTHALPGYVVGKLSKSDYR